MAAHSTVVELVYAPDDHTYRANPAEQGFVFRGNAQGTAFWNAVSSKRVHLKTKVQRTSS